MFFFNYHFLGMSFHSFTFCVYFLKRDSVLYATYVRTFVLFILLTLCPFIGITIYLHLIILSKHLTVGLSVIISLSCKFFVPLFLSSFIHIICIDYLLFHFFILIYIFYKYFTFIMGLDIHFILTISLCNMIT